MSEQFEWLPTLQLLPDYGGVWSDYVDHLYEGFVEDFLDRPLPTFRGKPIRLKSVPALNGRHGAFWHFLSEGDIEDDRQADMRRCEHLRWPRAIIDAEAFGKVHCWLNRRGRNTHAVLSLPDYSYVVILADRRSYWILCSAYPVTNHRRAETLRIEHEAYIQAQTTEAAPRDGFSSPSTRGG